MSGIDGAHPWRGNPLFQASENQNISIGYGRIIDSALAQSAIIMAPADWSGKNFWGDAKSGIPAAAQRGSGMSRTVAETLEHRSDTPSGLQIHGKGHREGSESCGHSAMPTGYSCRTWVPGALTMTDGTPTSDAGQ